MEWHDDGIVLGVRPFGEHGAILELLTRAHGRHLGLLRTVASKRMRGTVELGNALSVHWRARIDQQLGSYSLELQQARAPHFFHDGLKLAGLSSACAVCVATLPEREVHERVFTAFDGLLQHMMLDDAHQWARSYVRFELVLLEDLGFGLDLSLCAVTGEKQGLAFVSPKTGRAVTQEGAGAYVDRLLVLPAFLTDGDAPASVDEIARGLSLTQFFLERVVRDAHAKDLPAPRLRFGHQLGLLGSAGAQNNVAY